MCAIDDVFVGLGSNLGNAREYFDAACGALAENCEIIARSSLYQTRPYGVAEQPDFTNAVIRLQTCLDPLTLLTRMQQVERDLGKISLYRYGPRRIDLDLLIYGNCVIHDDEIDVPHTGIPERDFVLLPLHEIAPELIHPELNRSVSELLSDLKERYFTGKREIW